MLLFLVPSPCTISAHINTETSVFINNNSSGHFMTPSVSVFISGDILGTKHRTKTLRMPSWGKKTCRGGMKLLLPELY